MPHKMTMTKQILVVVIVFMITCLVSSIILGTVVANSSIQNNTRSRQGFTHTVFAEDFTAEWCVYCPSASETLKDIYNSAGYNFYFVCMITQDADQNVISQDAQDRANELGISSYPTVEFDGGYYEVTGGQDDDSNYVDAIETCVDRDAPNIYIDLTAQYNGGAEIDIDLEITNDDSETYSGTLRV